MQFIAGRSWLEYNFGGTRGRNLSLRCCGMLRGEFNRLKSHGVDGEAGKTESWGRVFCGSQGMTAASWCRLSIFRKFVIAKEGFRYIEMFWDIFWGFLRYIENYIYVCMDILRCRPTTLWISDSQSKCPFRTSQKKASDWFHVQRGFSCQTPFGDSLPFCGHIRLFGGVGLRPLPQ